MTTRTTIPYTIAAAASTANATVLVAGRAGARVSPEATSASDLATGEEGNGGPGREGPLPPGSRTPVLVELDRGAGLFELRLDRVGLLLGGTLLDGRRCAVHEVLRLLEAETGDGAHDLDHLDLLAAGVRQHDVEGRLLLGLGRSGATTAAAARRGYRDGGGRRDAPLVLDLLLELDQLEHAHRAQLLEDSVNCRHRLCLLVL